MKSLRQSWTVARRDVRGYFDHPTAYILVVAFLALGLFLTFRTLYVNRIGTLRPFFDLLPWLMALFVPALTMRALAEERRAHTLEWLLAQPLSERDVVVGKFLGNWTVVLLALAGTVPTAIGVRLASNADIGIMLAQYTGAALLAAQSVAIGLWASSVTRNQITAFILAASLSVALVLLGLPIVTIGLPPLLSSVASQLSVLRHFEGVARGVVDLRDVLYFASMTALFLVLAGFALARERLSRARGAYRRLRLGTAIVAAGVIVLNLLGGYVHGRLDLTAGRLYTLEPGMRTLVRDLPDIVQIKLYVSDALPPEVQPVLRDVRDLVRDIERAARGNVRVLEFDPEADEKAAAEAQSLGVQPTTFNVLRDDEFQVKRGWLGLAVLYANEQRVIPLVDRSDDLEFRLASYISVLTATHKPGVAMLGGYGARASAEFRALQEGLRDRYAVRDIDLASDSAALDPDSSRVALLAAPTSGVDSAGRARLDAYLNRGGALLLLLETAQVNPQYPQAMPVMSGLDPLLQHAGLSLKPGLVYDLRSHANVMVGRQGPFGVVSGYPLWPVVGRAGEHATTRNLENVNLGWATALDIRDTSRVKPLWRTTEVAGVRNLEMPIMPQALGFTAADAQGAQVVAAVVDSGPRMIVVGDADFLTDRFAQDAPQNLIFAANALDWLAQDDVLIRIRSKHRTPPALVFESAFGSSALKWGNLVGVPLVFAAIGALRIGRRTARARKQWAPSEGGNQP